ncbi:MAG: phosphoadenosine phosphosulfate reductase family protein [Clostridia bacterium]|nr:phosphoadenosine phosphosulfate reductase family protein [Clostridia bacterium]
MPSELTRKIDMALKRIETFQRPEGLYLAFSGGKDSVVTKHLLDMAGAKYDAHYRVTSVDPPELVRFIRDQYGDVEREVPRDDAGKPITMWNLIPRKLMPPTRLVRYCCEELKESGGEGRMTVTGVRWAESKNREDNQGVVTIMSRSIHKELDGNTDFRPTRQGGVMLMNDNDENRKLVEFCYRRHKTTLNPIIDWTDAEIWQFIRQKKIPYCCLYDEGFHRLGCIGCPMATRHGRSNEFARWSKYKTAYLHAFEKMIQERDKRGKIDGTWRMGTDPMEIFHWWMQDGVMPGQFVMEEFDDDWR